MFFRTRESSASASDCVRKNQKPLRSFKTRAATQLSFTFKASAEEHFSYSARTSQRDASSLWIWNFAHKYAIASSESMNAHIMHPLWSGGKTLRRRNEKNASSGLPALEHFLRLESLACSTFKLITLKCIEIFSRICWVFMESISGSLYSDGEATWKCD